MSQSVGEEQTGPVSTYSERQKQTFCVAGQDEVSAASCSVATEITAEQPFVLTTKLAAAPRQPPLLLPSDGLSTSAALGGEGPDGRVALPLHAKCLLSAHLRCTAPCEVGHTVTQHLQDPIFRVKKFRCTEVHQTNRAARRMPSFWILALQGPCEVDYVITPRRLERN